MIIFKVTKKQGRILTLEIQFSKKHRGKGGGGGGGGRLSFQLYNF